MENSRHPKKTSRKKPDHLVDADTDRLIREAAALDQLEDLGGDPFRSLTVLDLPEVDTAELDRLLEATDLPDLNISAADLPAIDTAELDRLLEETAVDFDTWLSAGELDTATDTPTGKRTSRPGKRRAPGRQ